jgi:F0F1-type ATP synthase membrane subunit b/b'
MENLAKIGIDFWSIILYIINYGLLLAVLSYFLYPKLRTTISNRKLTIKKNLEDAETLRKKLEDHVEKSDLEKAKLIHEVNEQRETAKKELKEAKVKLVSEMEAKRSKMLEEARAVIVEQKNLIITEAEKDVLVIIKSVILDILSNNVPEEAIENSIKKSWKVNKSKI